MGRVSTSSPVKWGRGVFVAHYFSAPVRTRHYAELDTKVIVEQLSRVLDIIFPDDVVNLAESLRVLKALHE